MRMLIGGALVVTLTGVLSYAAFRPAVDSVGPLTVRMEGPGQITGAGVPERLSVILENSGDTALQGSLRVQGIDRWTVQPSGPVPFAVAAKSSTTLAFTVTAVAPVFNAFYPIHAFAEFELQGRPQRAHPVLVVPVRQPDPPRPELPRELKPPASAIAAPVFPPQGRSRSLGLANGYDIRIWPGSRGLLDTVFGFHNGAQWLYFKGFQARVMGSALEDPRSVAQLLDASDESAGERYRIRHRFQ